MPPRTRMAPDERRAQLVDTAARAFARRPYDAVRMDEIAEQAEVSRGLLYRYFPSKRDLFAAVYRHAAAGLLEVARIDAGGDLADQVAAGLDAHLDYFEANRHTVVAANRTLAGDPVIQTIIDDELVELRDRLVAASGFSGHSRELATAAVLAWLRFVAVLSMDWLDGGTISRDELRRVCLGALGGVLSGLGTGASAAPRPR
jgi:AcrR family transcriptional regulator